MHIGIDLGGTKISAVALDAEGAERARTRAATPRDYPSCLKVLTGVVEELERSTGQSGSVGLSLPGLIAGQGNTIHAVNLPWLAGRPFADDLTAALARPVRLANDANCFVLSEATDGAAAAADLVFGIILGTGVGGGLVVHGRIVGGLHGLAGEWGHWPLPWRDEAGEGPPVACGCGRLGCIETELSGDGLARLHRRLTGRTAAGPEIAAWARQGDPAALAVLDRFYQILGKALAGLITVLDPEVIVVGGGLSDLPGLYQAVPQFWGRHGLLGAPRTRLVQARHGGDSGVRGAAWLWR